jgi:1-acyl-sn-glycerol-3-phosphate acyltransferase
MLEKTIPLIDAIFLLLSLLPMLYLMREKTYRRVVVFAFVLLFVSALFETNINGSFRHRMNGIVLLLPLVVIGLNKLLVDLTRFALNISKNAKEILEA